MLEFQILNSLVNIYIYIYIYIWSKNDTKMMTTQYALLLSPPYRNVVIYLNDLCSNMVSTVI